MQYFMNFLHKSKKHRKICSIPSKLLLIIHYVASQYFEDVVEGYRRKFAGR